MRLCSGPTRRRLSETASRWGWPFIEHTYLYHLRRLDHRHNFSPYFYSMYLGSSPGALAPVSHWLRSPLASFVPQAAVVGAAGLKYGADNLSYACFVATVAFVTLNKVCTSQVRTLLSLLSLCSLARLTRTATVLFVVSMAAACGHAQDADVSQGRSGPRSHVGGWAGLCHRARDPSSQADVDAQAMWLGQAYRLEMLGEARYRETWLASVVFMVLNGAVLGALVK